MDPISPLPATIGLTRGHGLFGALVRAVTRSKWGHAFIATGVGDEIIEAEPTGAQRAHAAKYSGEMVWLPALTSGMTPADRQAAVAWAVDHLGTPYSWVDDLEIGFVDLFGWAPGWMKARLASDSTLMCSQLCVGALRAGGHDLFPTRPDGGVSPGDLGNLAARLQKVGVRS